MCTLAVGDDGVSGIANHVGIYDDSGIANHMAASMLCCK